MDQKHPTLDITTTDGITLAVELVPAQDLHPNDVVFFRSYENCDQNIYEISDLAFILEVRCIRFSHDPRYEFLVPDTQLQIWNIDQTRR